MAGTMNAEQKATQRARNKAAGVGSRSGSSGLSTLLLDMERKTWDEVESVADHIADVGALFYSGQITAGGTITLQLGVPIEYAHDATDISIAAKQGALFIRVYVVTPESMMRPVADTDDELDDSDDRS